MKNKLVILKTCLVLFAINLSIDCIAQQASTQELPNILWLTSEDNSPLLGCYGDKMATSPNLDKLAQGGFLYTHAYSNAPVCAPSRNTIITGVYASSAGNENMRSYYSKSEIIRFLPDYLHDKGYYCTNNDKMDYNVDGDRKNIWDECSKEAHYKNRKPGQPFFAVFNSVITHESCLFKPDSGQALKHDPGKIKLSPYHPDTKEMRRDYARFYDAIENMDSWVGAKLKELDEAGLTENTIVIYYGDHGGILGRSKRFLYETGTRAPFIIRIPKKFKHLYPAEKPGSSVDRLISFVDLIPTMLSITGTTIPGYLQGKAFLGPQKTPDPQYIHMFRGRMDERIDLSRALRDNRYRYIRNYMPYRIYAQHINYLWKAPSMNSWWEEYIHGKCNEVQSRFFQTKPVEELYDTENDPWEVNNLANVPAYKDILVRMRKENSRWMKETYDAGFIPEGEKAKISAKTPLYDYMRSGAQSMDALLAASDLTCFATAKDIPTLEQNLSNKSILIRYWAACGLLQLGNQAKPAVPSLKRALSDSSSDVAIAAAEVLYRLGYKTDALPVLFNALQDKENTIRLSALNVIDNTCITDDVVRETITNFLTRADVKNNEYTKNISNWILEKPGSKKQ